jgi:hypothetical protein
MLFFEQHEETYRCRWLTGVLLFFQ